MNKNDKKGLSRREFLKRLGLGAAVTTAALTGCAPKKKESASLLADQGSGEMTYRTTPTTGDKVSLLG